MNIAATNPWEAAVMNTSGTANDPSSCVTFASATSSNRTIKIRREHHDSDPFLPKVVIEVRWPKERRKTA